MKYILLPLALLFSVKAFELNKGGKDSSFTDDEIDIFNSVLSNDQLFDDMKEIGRHKFNEYFTRFNMSWDNKKDATKRYNVFITRLAQLLDVDAYKHMEKEVVPEDDVDIKNGNLDIRKFIAPLHLPGISPAYTYRTILAKGKELRDLDFPSKTLEDIPVVYSVTIIEIKRPMALMLSDFVKAATYNSNGDKLEALRDFLYKLVHSIQQLNDNGILTGNLSKDYIVVADEGCSVGDNIAFDIYLDHYAFHYRENKWAPDIARYKDYYQSPELNYFLDGIQIKTGPTGFKYSGYEDLFAVAVIVWEVSKKMEAELDEDLELLLNDMMFPVTVEHLEDLGSDESEKIEAAEQDIKHRMNELLSENFQEKIEELHDKAKEICEMIENLGFSNKRLRKFIKQNKAEYYDEFDLLHNKFYFLYREFMREFYGNELYSDDLIQILSNGDMMKRTVINYFLDLEEELLNKNPFENVIKERIEPNRILYQLYLELNPESGAKQVKSNVREDLRQLKEQAENRLNELDGNPELISEVYIHPSIYDLPLESLKPFVAELADNLRVLDKNNVDLVLDKEFITMPEQTIETYTPGHFAVDFVAQVKELLKQKKNRNKTFNEIYPIRLVRKLEHIESDSEVKTPINKETLSYKKVPVSLRLNNNKQDLKEELGESSEGRVEESINQKDIYNKQQIEI